MRRRDAWKTSGIFAAACTGLFLVLTGSAGASPVSAPTSLAASAVSSSQINLTWVDTNSNETAYLVERSLSSSSGFVQIASLAPNTQSYSNAGLAAGTTYYYQVRAAHSGAFSAYSNVAQAKTLSTAPTPTRTPTPPAGPTPTRTPTPPGAPTPTPTTGSIPPPPTNLTATAVSSITINLAWTDNSTNETAFRVERSPAAAGPWTYIGAATQAAYGDSLLQPSTLYFYRVAAYNSAGTSAYTNTASATTQVGLPPPPSNLLASSVSSSQINLTWVDASTNETGFKIERAPVSTGPWAQIGTTGTNVASYSSTGLSASTTYFYRVRATNASGDSGYTNTASAATQASGGGSVWSHWYGASGEDGGASVALDGSGNVVVAGHYQGVVDLGTGSMTSFTAGSGPTMDGFVAKYSPSGVPVWSRGFGGDSADAAQSVAVDSSGNVVVTGFQASTSADYGGGLLSSRGSRDIFVAKYLPSGGYVWAKTIGGTGLDSGSGVAVDGAGNVYVTGYFSTSTAGVDFGCGALFSAGSQDVFLVKYNAAGGCQWSKRFGSTGSDTGNAVAVDTSGNVVIFGNFIGSIDFGVGALTSAGQQDIFVAKFSSAGNYMWAKRFGGTGLDNARGLAVDGSGNVALTGDFVNTINFGVGGPSLTAASAESDIFVAKLSGADGSHIWSKRLGSNTTGDAGYGVAMDSGGNVAVTGYFGQNVDFGNGVVIWAQGYDIFVAKYSSATGAYISAKRLGDPAGYFDGQFTNAIAMSGSGNVFITGYFVGTLDLGAAGRGTSTPYGGNDGFLASIGP
jgi:hypothetical protein